MKWNSKRDWFPLDLFSGQVCICPAYSGWTFGLSFQHHDGQVVEGKVKLKKGTKTNKTPFCLDWDGPSPFWWRGRIYISEQNVTLSPVLHSFTKNWELARNCPYSFRELYCVCKHRKNNKLILHLKIRLGGWFFYVSLCSESEILPPFYPAVDPGEKYSHPADIHE